MKFHTISGMPRSGSTLLCNVMNQNPKFFASSTSNLPMMIKSISNTWSNSIETKSLLDKFPEQTKKRMKNTLYGIVDSWYSHKSDKVVFDKSRAWTRQNQQLQKFSPDTKIIICVRDLREIFASVIKHSRDSALMDDCSENQSTMFQNQFDEKGIIGAPLVNVVDMLRTQPDNVYIWKYEEFVKNPKKIMLEVYEFIGEDYFEHNFKNVKNVSTERDGFYLGKFPHEGSGKVELQETSKWEEFVSKDIAIEIMKIGNFYNNKLGYETVILPDIGE